MHTPTHSNYGFNDPLPTSVSQGQTSTDMQEQSAGVQAPQYPAPASPSFSSLVQRQRMFMDDAMVATQSAEERKNKLLSTGGKAFVGYDKMLRGFMEAKYAKPELKFWDYAQNPSTSAAYRIQGQRKIADDVAAGVDIKDIPGMKFGSRQKEGLKGIFGKGTAPELKGEDLIIDTMEKAGADRIASEAAGKNFTTPTVQDQIEAAKQYKASSVGGIKDAAKQKAQVLQQKNIDSLEIDPIANYRGDSVAEAVKPATEEAAKGGLKSTLGKVAGGVGAGLSVASGVERLKSKDKATRIGGGLQVAGGAAQAVALTNFWNPAGWAAAIPAALSLGGSFMGGDRNALSRTPIGKSLRRLNIS